MPGTTFSFDDPGEAHHESEDVARAKGFLQRRYACPSRPCLADISATSVILCPSGCAMLQVLGGVLEEGLISI